jgi:hypothetical protein
VRPLAPRLRKLTGAVLYVHFAAHAASSEQLSPLYDALCECIVSEFGESPLRAVHLHAHRIHTALVWRTDTTRTTLRADVRNRASLSLTFTPTHSHCIALQTATLS